MLLNINNFKGNYDRYSCTLLWYFQQYFINSLTIACNVLWLYSSLFPPSRPTSISLPTQLPIFLWKYSMKMKIDFCCITDPQKILSECCLLVIKTSIFSIMLNIPVEQSLSLPIRGNINHVWVPNPNVCVCEYSPMAFTSIQDYLVSFIYF